MILVLGAGNTLCTDDGVGAYVIDALQRDASFGLPGVILRDGGATGLALLPEIQDADAVIVVDAGELGAPPGAVRCFEGPAMDGRLKGKRRTAHEVAVFDLFAAAELSGCLPQKRALVAIQPASTALGVEPTAEVRRAIPQACETVRALIGRWSNDG